jgi:hypothetical protein
VSPRSKYRTIMTVNLAGIAGLSFLAYQHQVHWPILMIVFWYLTIGVIAGLVRCRICGRLMGRIVNGWVWRLCPDCNCLQLRFGQLLARHREGARGSRSRRCEISGGRPERQPSQDLPVEHRKFPFGHL